MIYNLVIIFLYSIFASYVAIDYFRKRLIKYGYVVKDHYKHGRKMIPTMGGIPIFVGIIVSLSLSQLLIKNSVVGKLFIFYFIVTVYTLYGIVDDIFTFKTRYDKILALLVLSFPIASLMQHSGITIFNQYIELNGFLPFLFAPVYIMVVANMINVHSGFNGLDMGLGLILLITIGIKSFMLYGIEKLIFLLPVLGALLVFLPFNFAPAKILPGNAGQFLVGSAIGCALIINQLEVFGLIILIPHIINFCMDTYTLKIRTTPLVKYGYLRKDRTICAPPSMRFVSLKFLVTHYVRLTEQQATLICYGFTIIFCFAGLLIA